MSKKKEVKKKEVKKAKEVKFSSFEVGDSVVFGKQKGVIYTIKYVNDDNEEDIEKILVDFGDYSEDFNQDGHYVIDWESDESCCILARDSGLVLKVTDRCPNVKTGHYAITSKIKLFVEKNNGDSNDLCVTFNNNVSLDSITKKEFHESFPDIKFIRP